MLNTLVLDRQTRTFTRITEPEVISELREIESNIIWVDVPDPTSQDFDELAKEFSFHPLSIEDVRQEHQRPKVEEYSGYYFIVLYEAELLDDNQLKLRESEEMKSDRAYLDGLRQALTGQGFTVQTKLAMGDPATELIRSAEEQDVDLIAMSTLCIHISI